MLHRWRNLQFFKHMLDIKFKLIVKSDKAHLIQHPLGALESCGGTDRVPTVALSLFVGTGSSQGPCQDVAAVMSLSKLPAIQIPCAPLFPTGVVGGSEIDFLR